MGLAKILNYNFSSKGTYLNLEISIPLGMSVKELYLDTQETWKSNDCHGDDSPNLKNLWSIESHRVDNVYEIREVSIPIDTNNLAKTLHTDYIHQDDFIIVTIALEGSPEASGIITNTTCGCDSVTTRFPIYDLTKLRLRALDYLCEIKECNCDIPRGFLCKVMLIEAIELAIKVGYLHLAAELWKDFYGGNRTTHLGSTGGGCGCHAS